MQCNKTEGGIMYNLLFIVGTLSGAGGVQRSLSLLCNELMKQERYNVTIYCINGSDIWFPLDSRIETVFLEQSIASEQRRKKGFIGRQVRLYKSIKSIVRMNKQSNYHLIIGYGGSTRITIGLLLHLCMNKIVFCERENPESKHVPLWSKIDNAIGVSLVRHTNIAFLTKTVMRYYKSTKKVAVIPCFIDLEMLPNAGDWQNRDCKVISVGRYVYGKNQMMLIKAFISAREAYPQYSMELYGDGEIEDELMDLIKKCKAETYIKLMPSTTDIFSILNTARIFALSSNHEGYCNALLEAMAMGMACISTDCSGSVRDLIEDGVNGLVVPVNDVDSMSKALIKLMENDGKAGEMANRAVAVRETNAKEKVISDWIVFLNEMLEDAS